MSYSIEVTIWCDARADDGGPGGCGMWTYGGKRGPYKRASDARVAAAREGWARRDGRDLCPDHAKVDADG